MTKVWLPILCAVVSGMIGYGIYAAVDAQKRLADAEARQMVMAAYIAGQMSCSAPITD